MSRVRLLLFDGQLTCRQFGPTVKNAKDLLQDVFELSPFLLAMEAPARKLIPCAGRVSFPIPTGEQIYLLPPACPQAPERFRLRLRSGTGLHSSRSWNSRIAE